MESLTQSTLETEIDKASLGKHIGNKRAVLSLIVATMHDR